MEEIEVTIDTIKGTAILIDSSALQSIWEIAFENSFLIIEHSYLKAKTYTLIECGDIDVNIALNQMLITMWQIDQFIKSKRSRPPKRYR
jgi:K+ transporter